MHVLVLWTLREDFPPGDPGNAASGFAKVLLGRETHRQKHSFHMQGREEGSCFAQEQDPGLEVNNQCLLFNSCNC